MKFACDKENLLNAVQIGQRAVSLKNPLPILGGINLKRKMKELYFRPPTLRGNSLLF